jgi:spoIIIJ-associated protein
MSDKRANLEVIAPSIEEAVSKGLSELGLRAEDVDVEVLDEGSRGLFGIGSRQARVRLMVKTAGSEPAPAPESQETPPAPAPVERAPVERPAAASARPQRPEDVFDADEVLEICRDTVNELLERMKVRAQVTASFGEEKDGHGRLPVLVDVRGNDLSILIGPKAETLNALQYISGLIVSKELGHSITLLVDVEGYRKRRETQVRQIARRMAEQAIKTGKRQTLEPMPASERRLVHIELRNHPEVVTESVGEDPHRKVTIMVRSKDN